MSADDLILLPGGVDLATWVAAELRAADRAEVEALHDDVEQAVAQGFRMARWSTVATDRHGRLVAAWGVNPASIIPCGHGIPWCLTGDAVARHRRSFLALSRRCTEAMRREYRALLNVVDDRHVAAKRWLVWLGFTLGPPLPLGRRGELFRHFSLQGNGHG